MWLHPSTIYDAKELRVIKLRDHLLPVNERTGEGGSESAFDNNYSTIIIFFCLFVLTVDNSVQYIFIIAFLLKSIKTLNS